MFLIETILNLIFLLAIMSRFKILVKYHFINIIYFKIISVSNVHNNKVAFCSHGVLLCVLFSPTFSKYSKTERSELQVLRLIPLSLIFLNFQS